MCRCPLPLSNGAPAGGGGLLEFFRIPDFDVVGAVTVTQPIASLPVLGAQVSLQIQVVSRVVAGAPAGDVGAIHFGIANVQRGTTDAPVVPIYGPIPWGPPPGGGVPNNVLQPNGDVYFPPLTFVANPPGAVRNLQVTANVLELAATGAAGLTTRVYAWGIMTLRDGAVRLAA